MRLQHVAGLALSLSLAACAMEVEGEDEPGLEEAEQISFNQISFNQISFNGLTGSQAALEDLVDSTLTTATFDPETGVFPHQLNNADTRVFLKYLASCALSPEDPAIEFTDINGKPHSFPGGLGLCSAWAYGAPDQECQEIVSACLYARNNALGKSKMISPRGETADGVVLETTPWVPAKTTTITGASIPSFNACKVSLAGAARNCGWAAERSLLGTCTPNTDVTLNCKVGSAQHAVRVCDGLEGCSTSSPAKLAEGLVCGNGAQSIAFTCGPDGAFAAMTGPVNSGAAFDGSFAGATGATFPASELSLFKLREGAFFGNLFNPGLHSPDVSTIILPSGQAVIDVPMTSVDIPVYRDAWACYDPNWTTPQAYMHDRLCAIVNDGTDEAHLCIATTLGACLGGVAPRCSSGDVAPAGDQDFGGCKDNLNAVRESLTVMLHQPCDLLPPGSEANCQRRDLPRR